MLWLFYSLLGAFSRSARSMFSKLSVDHGKEDVFAVTAVQCIIAAPLLWAASFLIGFPVLGAGFYYAVIMTTTTFTLGNASLLKALKSSELSLVAPMLALTPVFLLVLGPLLLGEFPSDAGLIGVLLVTMGTYSLGASKCKQGIFGPLRTLASDNGVKLALLTALIFAFTAIYLKLLIVNSDPFYSIAVLLTVSAGVNTIIALMRGKKLNINKALGGAGLATAAEYAFINLALGLTQVQYVIAVKRTSALFDLKFGNKIFNEDGGKYRLFGAGLIVVGVILISIA